jgi:hypothetical protein
MPDHVQIDEVPENPSTPHHDRLTVVCVSLPAQSHGSPLSPYVNHHYIFHCLLHRNKPALGSIHELFLLERRHTDHCRVRTKPTAHLELKAHYNLDPQQPTKHKP